MLLRLGLQRVELRLALGLVGHDGLAEAVLGERAHRVVHVVAEERLGLPRLLRDADGVHELLLELDHLGDRDLGGLEALGDRLLGRGGGAVGEQRPRVVGRLALDHQDVDHARLVAAAGDDDVERRLLGLLERGVHDPLAVDQGHADGADRTVERQTGEAGGDGRRVHRGDVVRVLAVHAEHGDDDLDLVAVALPERRPQRTVDQPAGQDRRLGRAALPAEEAAGDLADRVHPLFDVDREREEVDPLAGVGADAGAEHLRLAVRRP